MEPRKPITNVDNSSWSRIINTLESVDRISSLPDSILGVILSFLPTKNAVATSTLSKRWEFLWRTVHNLEFSLNLDRGLMYEQVEAKNKKFVGFVNHVLAHHDAGVLNKFRLVWTPHFIQSHATSWIKTVVTRNVHELSLTLYRNGLFDMPINVFSRDSLRSLQLDGRIRLSAASVFFFPRLESLHLYGVTFESEEAFEKIIRGCPVLNYLDIDIDEDDNRVSFIISSTSLKCLELHFRCRKYLKLEASSLEHLKISGYIPVNFVQKKLSSLVEASFGNFLDDKDFSQAGICNSVVDAVSALDRAKILTLTYCVMKALSCATIKLSTDFERLVKLETSIKCCHWSSVQYFIQSSNSLEVLTIYKFQKHPVGGNDHDHSNWTTPIEVPRCLSNSLKKVVLNGYYGYEDEREMIRYMLKHGSVLEAMEISCHTDGRREIELVQEIREFPRKSPACEVKLCG